MYITREQREEAKQYVQQKYGHYCNKARQMNITPMSYTTFKQEFNKDVNASMRSIVEKLEMERN